MPGLNDTILNRLSEENSAQIKILAALQERMSHISKSVEHISSRLDSIETKLFIGNGKPSIAARLTSLEEEQARLDEDQKLLEESKKNRANLIYPIAFSVIIGIGSMLAQVYDKLVK